MLVVFLISDGAAMRRLLDKLLIVLAAATDRELDRHVQFLKVENEILRSKLPTKISITAQEKRRLILYGKELGAAIHELIGIVSPRTFARWVNGEKSKTSRFVSRDVLRRMKRSASWWCDWLKKMLGAIRASLAN
jgi:hypothetical protein